jgi:hypothetical protein
MLLSLHYVSCCERVFQLRAGVEFYDADEVITTADSKRFVQPVSLDMFEA